MLLFLPKKDRVDITLLFILSLSVASELLSFIFHPALRQIYNVYFILSFGLWLLLASGSTNNLLLMKLTISIFFVLAVLNLNFFQDFTRLNTNTFIAGSFLYCIQFLLESFKRLKKDDLDFFMNDHFLLLFSPVLFFVGFSFIFGFNDSPIKDTIILPGIDLYTFVSYLVNITFYTLLNIYCIRRFKSSKGWLKK